jgi:c(7)-type cytochrome triheme protein
MRSNSRLGFLSKRLCERLVLILILACGVPSAAAEYGDVVLNRLSEANDMRPVIFPHWFHHELGFEMRAGANEIDMGKIIDGQYCGMCHNGQVAWSVDECHLCHSGKPGLQTGIRGSNQTGGPGRW